MLILVNLSGLLFPLKLNVILLSFSPPPLLRFFNTPSACGGVTDKKSGPRLALRINTIYLKKTKLKRLQLPNTSTRL
jgi:hypothetical protein